MKLKINYFFLKDFLKGKENKAKFKKETKSIIIKILQNENQTLSFLNLIFCDNKTIREYNNKFLSHDYDTDIITFFDYDETNILFGELIISVEKVRENALAYKTTYDSELKRVIIHGVLHLCGYDDKTKSEKLKMRKRENFYLT
ncbi:MAG: rRNA maturation RNase YbeY [Bacteroidetes bacterium]|nr:rRNA maturation RNase YbeY [Bacteroidota bacterium]MBX7045280.1 rRNA maturation RNase YbeY [Ignavibacteria bacterium]